MVLRGLKLVCMKELRVDWAFPADIICSSEPFYIVASSSIANSQKWITSLDAFFQLTDYIQCQ